MAYKNMIIWFIWKSKWALLWEMPNILDVFISIYSATLTESNTFGRYCIDWDYIYQLKSKVEFCSSYFGKYVTRKVKFMIFYPSLLTSMVNIFVVLLTLYAKFGDILLGNTSTFKYSLFENFWATCWLCTSD